MKNTSNFMKVSENLVGYQELNVVSLVETNQYKTLNVWSIFLIYFNWPMV